MLPVRYCPLAAALLVPCLGLSSSPLQAQSEQAAASAEQDSEEPLGNDIVVTAFRPRGSVVGDTVIEAELNEEDIAGFGASNIEELVEQLTPLTRTGRGNGGGAPVMLVNGRRISSPREIRSFPPEAIRKVQVLPEEVALRYGYPADQRVINFILKPRFSAFTTEAEYGQSWDGDRYEPEFDAGYLRLFEKGRLAINGEYAHKTAILESDRGIVDSTGSTGPGHYRTLLPRSDQLRLNGLYSRALGETLSLTVNVRHDRTDSLALQGLDTLTGKVREKDGNDQTSHAAVTLDGNWSRWQWTLTGNADLQRSLTLTDVSGLTSRDRALSRLRTLDSDLNATGPLIALPAGDAMLALRVGVSDSRLTSEREQASGTTSKDLSRDEGFVRANLDLPVARANRDVLPFLGTLSANINGTVRHVSDYGTLVGYGYGFSWKPARNLDLSASLAQEENAPSMQALGNPTVVTSGVSVYDFSRQETVQVDIISGGNPALRREVVRNIKFGATWEPQMLPGIALIANYYINRSTNPISGFPLLTPAIEAAFPGRVVRDLSGQIVSIDQRSINYAEARNQSLRYGVSFSRSFGKKNEANPAEGLGRPSQASRQAGGGPRFGPAPSDGGRWNIDLFHTVKFQDEIRLGPGQPALDLLDGGATGSSGGSARHLVELDGGWIFRGLGFRASAQYQSGSHVTGGTAGSDLHFSDLFTLNMRVFLNFDGQKSLVEKAPWLKGARLRLRVTNLTGAIRNVRDATGVVPVSYQPGYLDARGRFIDLNFRKQF